MLEKTPEFWRSQLQQTGWQPADLDPLNSASLPLRVETIDVMGRENVIIIGGGVIGTACAYYLSKTGRKVTIVDRELFGMACSHGNCGIVSPSHVFPLAGPGAVRKALTAMRSRNSPFSIKPRLDLSLWLWLLRFARCCDLQHMIEAGRDRHVLLSSSMTLYRQLLADEALDCEWETRGLLHVFLSQETLEGHEETVNLVREHYGVSARRYGRDEVANLEPALKPDVAGGWHYEEDAHLRPDKLLSSWRSVLEAAGVEIREHCDVRSFDRNGGRAGAIQTSLGRLAADWFVVAAGALTPLLNKHLGCRVPIQPGKGYSITMPRPAKCPSIPMIFDEHRVAVTPMQSGYRLGSIMEFAGYDTSINPKRIALLKNGASHYLHEPFCDPIQNQWYGWRPMTYDGRPFIDRSPAMQNVYLAAGHNMLGLSMAPATGKLIAELIQGDIPHIDPEPYSLRRLRS